MSALSKTEHELLRVLAESYGLETKTVSQRVNIEYGRGSPHIRSGAIRSWLNALMKRGLVGHLDSGKPVCWIRTRQGSLALRRND